MPARLVQDRHKEMVGSGDLGIDARSAKSAAGQRLRAFLDQMVDAGVPGISIAIASERGICAREASGFSDVRTKAPMTVDHACGIGSITKPMVAILVLRLISTRIVSGFDKVTDILAPPIIEGIANTHRATLFDLLSHHSGIPSWEDDPAWIRRARGADLDAARVWGKTDPLDYIRGEQHPALFEAGTRYSYSNTNYTLLGLVLEALVGRELTQQIRDGISTPLGFTRTYMESHESPLPGSMPQRYHYGTDDFLTTAGAPRSASMATRDLLDVTETNLSVEWAAGGLISTVDDLVLFADAVRRSSVLNGDELAMAYRWRRIDDRQQVGNGFFRWDSSIGPVIGHSGSTLGFSAMVLWSEAKELSMALLTNVGGMHTGSRRPPVASEIAFATELLPIVHALTSEA